MIITICLIIIFACIWSACSDADEQDLIEWQYEVDERRHQELLEATKNKNRKSTKHRRTRTIACDEQGRTVMQEIKDDYYDDDDDYYDDEEEDFYE